ncbi:hypothetical protein ABW19_dt0203295 [Dactylella cylindrospora]|nr:hypothetical protein ABW19_dt0203295 [Dactylella cylindrospora]
MVETRSRIVTLDTEVDVPIAFEMFLHFCYLGDYFSNEQEKSDLLLVNAQVYVFADRIQCTDLKTVALRKATRICKATEKDALQEIFVVLPDTITLVYSFTVDNESGNLPAPSEPISKLNLNDSIADATADSESIPTETEVVEVSPVYRDGFRMLLAMFSAAHLDLLRKQQPFVQAHHAMPDFSTDMMLFVSEGKRLVVDPNGDLKVPYA